MKSEEPGSGVDYWTNDIHQGDAVETLRKLPESSVHCVMTSPPYFGLRDYEVDGQIGLEETVDKYISELEGVALEIRRVLRDDGNWWLNLGDSFAGSGRGQWTDDDGEPKESDHPNPDQLPEQEARFRRKSKMLIPHRVAIALQDAGWIVRSDAVWSKPAAMPNPVKDRLNEHKEFLFHLTPAPDYWFDLDAVREPQADASFDRIERAKESGNYTGELQMAGHPGEDGKYARLDPGDACHPNGKNPGDVLEISTKPFPEAHFAVYPPELCETPIKSSCPERVCVECSTPYERTTRDVPVWERDRSTIERPQLRKALERFDNSDLTEEHLKAVRATGFSDAAAGKQQSGAGRNTDETEQLAREAKDVLGGYFREITMTDREIDGWSQACDCETSETESGIVLDPFAGVGTTALVAKRLGRQFIGIDLNPEYVAMAQRRVGVDVDDPERLLDDGERPLSAFTDGGV